MFKVFKTKAADGLSFENADLKLQKKKKKEKGRKEVLGLTVQNLMKYLMTVAQITTQ